VQAEPSLDLPMLFFVSNSGLEASLRPRRGHDMCSIGPRRTSSCWWSLRWLSSATTPSERSSTVPPPGVAARYRVDRRTVHRRLVRYASEGLPALVAGLTRYHFSTSNRKRVALGVPIKRVLRSLSCSFPRPSNR